jgi:hypothetical protein
MRGPLGETAGKNGRPPLRAVTVSGDQRCRISYSRDLDSESSQVATIRALRDTLHACGMDAVVRALQTLIDQHRIDVITAQGVSALVFGQLLEVHTAENVEVEQL